jgi:hypothetical protein
MFDNLPFTVRDKPTIKSFIESGLLVSVAEKVGYSKDGEQYTKTINYKYKNLYLTLNYSSKDIIKNLTCKGSFHYLMNDGVHNANNYTLDECILFLHSFASKFGIDLQYLVMAPSEFGININIPFDVRQVVAYTYFVKRQKFGYSPTHVLTSKKSGKPSNNHCLKIYSKSHDLPNHCEPNTLRMELKFHRVRYLEHEGVVTFKDLTIERNWLIIREKFFDEFEHLLIYDYLIKEPSNNKIKNLIKDYSNQKYWIDLVDNCANGKCSNDQYNDHLQGLNELSKKYGVDLKTKILALAYKQWDAFFVDSKKPKHAQLSEPKHAPCIVCNPIRTSKFCIVTGIDISMQRPSSKYLSNTGLKYLELNDLPTFLILKKSLLTGHVNKFEKDIYSKMSKQIRNRGGSRPPVDPNQFGISF